MQHLIDAERHREGALLPILHALQNQFGHIPPDSIPLITRALRITRADVDGVISFYPHFRREPAGRQVIQLCRAEACQARGCRELEAHVKAKLGIDFNETTPDRRFTLEPVYCLGNCAVGPNLLLNNQLVAKVDAQRFDRLVNSLAAEAVESEPGV